MPIKRTITKARRSAPTQGVVEECVDLFVHDGCVHGRPVLEFGRVVMSPYARADREAEPTFVIASTNARGTTRLRVFHAPPPPGLSTTRPLDLWTDDTTLSMTLRGVKKDMRAHVEHLLMPGYRTLYVNGVQFRQGALRAASESGVERGSPVTIEAAIEGDPAHEFDVAALKVLVDDHFVGHVPRGLTGVVTVGTDAEVLRLAQWPGPVGQTNTRPFYIKIKVCEAATGAATE